MGYRIVGSDLGADIALEDMTFDEPTVLVLGNERDGLTPRMLGHCDATFHIPMHGFAQSFNVSVAAAISLHRAVVQWRRHIGRAGDLPDALRADLRDRYLRLAVDNSDLVLQSLELDLPPLPDEPAYLTTAPDLVDGRVPRFVTKTGEWE
jgi:tRNA (guanosine-2'-O-)-methyltransferase